jgi:hypothetical protein
VIILDKFGEGQQNWSGAVGRQEQRAPGVVLRPARESHQAICDLNFRPFPAFLTGSALRTEIAVTRSKQMTASILTGARIAHLNPRQCAAIKENS